MFSSDIPKNIFAAIFVALAGFSTVFAAENSPAAGSVVVESKGSLGTIKGIVRDRAGSPIADAYVSIFRVGTSKLLKQARSAADGSFLVKIVPGTYMVLAIAQGFNSETLAEVSVNPAAELNYGFKLEPSGGGNTLPERKIDRNSSKWRIRAAQSRRSVYQNAEGDAPVDETEADAENHERVEESIAVVRSDEETGRRGQTVVETYFADSAAGNFAGVNFATLVPLGETAEIVLAGQTGTANAPQRFESNIKFRPNDNHQLRVNAGIAHLGKFETNNSENTLGQVSVQALDEWRVKDGVILVFGLDYSRFTGAGEDFSISPRLGLQFDVNSKTRFRSSYTTQTEEKNWARAIELEGQTIAFTEPTVVQDFVVENDKPLMNKSRRLEFGVERVLDNDSNIEANAFFDATLSRGVGLMNLPFNALGSDDFSDFVANQQGRSQGVRVVYNRRFGGRFSTAAGYSFGNGQKLSETGISNPADMFENDFFQTFFGQFSTDIERTGTSVKAIYRLSSQATVFAIDPFQGRLAIYDPGMSVLVTQSLPNLGLPIRAEAIVDARNLFDFQTGLTTEDGALRLNSQRRMLRGGILVRF